MACHGRAAPGSRLGALISCFFIAWISEFATPCLADVEIYIERGSVWRYHRGTTNPSPASRDAWTENDFSDNSWAAGSAPIGYGDGPFGVDLSNQNPEMEDNYTTVCLRTSFSLDAPASVSELQAIVDYDDGFAMWINGNEVARVNVSSNAGWDDTASGSHESGSYETFDLDVLDASLRAGENVVAVQLFNRSLGSSDAKIDVELLNPSAPDRTAPRIARIGPAAGTTVRALSQIEIEFDEDVRGVDAADLEIDGSPATSMTGSGAGPYVFSFPAIEIGDVDIAWRESHGIEDLSSPANEFVRNSWSYTVDPDAPLARLRITEILASNLSGLRDEDGDRSDWIEVTNEGAETVSLEGYSLTDDLENPSRWIFPRVSLGPGARLVVFASGKDRRPTNGDELHTDFKLAEERESVAVFSDAVPRELLSFIDDYPPQRADVSFGVDATGELRYFSPPTPGSSNDTSEQLLGLLPPPRASEPRGFYESAISVELLASDAEATIWYTLDGREPGPGTGQRYTSPIEVDGTDARAVVTLRASVHRAGFVSSSTRTWTYLFLDHVLRQPNDPTGFSRSWGAAPGVDYGMDPRIADSDTYREAIRSTLADLPTLSIVMDEDDMFGSSGIYSNPTREGVAWERAASVELIYPDGRDGFDVRCGIRVQGGASRQPIHSPKHSLRLLFKGAYGPTKLRFPLFETSDVDTFDTVILRANFNNSWISRRVGQRARGQLHRDQWFRDKQAEMSGTSSHGDFVHVYINGLYWGVYNPSERPSGAFGAEHYGGEKEEWDSLNSGVVVDGGNRAWSTMFSLARSGLSSAAQLAAIGEYLDLEHFADYMLLNCYGGNTDWPGHNWYAVRRRREGDGFKFISWDAERSLENIGENRIGVNGSNNPAELWQALRQNPEFRQIVADRAHKHFFGAGALTIASAFGRYDTRARELFDAVAAESARWGDYRETVHRYLEPPYLLYTRDEHWTAEYLRLSGEYFPVRTDRFLDQLRNASLYPRVDAPNFSRPRGRVVTGSRVALSATSPDVTILFTTDGSDPRVRGSGAVSAAARVYEGPFTISSFIHIRARARDGVAWSALAEASLYTPPDDSAIAFSELFYNPSSSVGAEFVEITNLGTETISLEGVAFDAGAQFRFDENDSLAPGEHLVIVGDRVEFARRYPEVPSSSIAGEFSGSLDNAGETLRLVRRFGDSTTTVSSLEYDDDGFWELTPDGFGFSLVLREASADPSSIDLDDPRAWRASAMTGGSPGRRDPDVSRGGVRVHEIFANATDSSERFVELHNETDSEIDVGAWLLASVEGGLSDLGVVVLPAGSVISARGFLAFSADELESRSAQFSLDPRGGRVVLVEIDASGDLTGYIVGADYGAADDPTSYGVHETLRGLDFTALARETPNATNATPRVPDVTLNEVHYHPLDEGGGTEFIELLNTTDATIDLSGWTLSGVSDFFEDRAWRFPSGTTIDAGDFALVVPIDPEEFRARHDVDELVPILGPFGGALDNGGERLRLRRPLRQDETTRETIDEVRFNDRAPWPEEADGTGPSLERIHASSYGRDPESWAASLEDGGTPGRTNSTAIEDGGLQRPGDLNQDLVLDLTDGIGILGHLFGGLAVEYPCDDGSPDGASNIALLDSNGNGGVELADAIHLFQYLFQGGPAHALGIECVRLENCPDACP